MIDLIEYVEKNLAKELNEIKNGLIDQEYSTLMLEEKALIYKYTEDGYISLNKSLRRNNGKNKLDFGKLLFEVLKKVPVYTGLVYRSVDLSKIEIEQYIDAECKSEVIAEYAFLSTSRSILIGHNFAKSCRFTIMSKTGRLIESWSKYGSNTSQNEKEVLFLPNCKFNVLGVTNDNNNTLLINLEEQ